MWDCHTTLPQRIDLALNGCLRNWRLRTRLGRSHRQIRKIVKPPWCAVPTRGVGGIVNSKVLFRRHAVKPNVTELRSHKGSWQIQPRNSRWLASVVGKTHRNASANLFWAFVMPALRIIDTPSDSHKGSLRKPSRASAAGGARRTPGPVATSVDLFTPHSTQIGAAESPWRCWWTAAAACEPSAATAAWPAGRFAEARRLWRQHRDHAPRHQRHRQGPRVGRP